VKFISLLVMVLALVVGVCGIVAMIAGIAEENTTLAIIGGVIGVAGFAGFVVLIIADGKRGKAAFEAQRKDGFLSGPSGWYYGSGLAHDPQGQRLLVSANGATTVVPLAEITALDYTPERIGPVVSGNNPLALLMLPMQIAAVYHNAKRAGLFVGTPAGRLRIYGIKEHQAREWSDRLGHLLARR